MTYDLTRAGKINVLAVEAALSITFNMQGRWKDSKPLHDNIWKYVQTPEVNKAFASVTLYYDLFKLLNPEKKLAPDRVKSILDDNKGKFDFDDKLTKEILTSANAICKGITDTFGIHVTQALMPLHTMRKGIQTKLRKHGYDGLAAACTNDLS